MDDQARHDYARNQVRALKIFYGHVALFLLINVFLFVLNLASSPRVLWFVWPLAGWGLGLGLHAFVVFVVGGFWGPHWEERKIREIVGELQNQR